jgi:hypothetical protein
VPAAVPAPASGRGGAAPARKPSPIAEIFRDRGDDYLRSRPVTPGQVRVLRAVQRCRTAALGGHLEICDRCGFSQPAYNSCRDRHCPVCQALAQHRWLQQRMQRVLPAPHFHLVFTLPSELRPLALRNPVVVFDILFSAAWEILDTLGEERLSGQIGATLVLHTWTRAMLFHPHVHCVVTGGALRGDDAAATWCPSRPAFLFPVGVLREMFRGVVRRKLLRAHRRGNLDLGGDCAAWADEKAFRDLFRGLHGKKWIVYAKRPFAGTRQVFEYLGQYTHRVAISDHRVLAVSKSDVTIKTRGDGRVTLPKLEFIRRFLLHVLPPGFHKIRHFGLYAGAHVRDLLPRARRVLDPDRSPAEDAAKAAAESWEALVEALSDRDPRRCPCCRVGTLLRVPLPRSSAAARRPGAPPPPDSS